VSSKKKKKKEKDWKNKYVLLKNEYQDLESKYKDLESKYKDLEHYNNFWKNNIDQLIERSIQLQNQAFTQGQGNTTIKGKNSSGTFAIQRRKASQVQFRGADPNQVRGPYPGQLTEAESLLFKKMIDKTDQLTKQIEQKIFKKPW